MGNSILIVDDNVKNIQVLGNFLKQENYEIAVALSGKEALEWVNSDSIDLILLDIMMPEMDGYTVCKAIRDNTQNSDTPIIFITAKNDIESVVKGFETGGVDYLVKPFNSQELLSRVKTHIELKTTRDKLVLAKNELEKEKEKADKLLVNILNERFVNDLMKHGKVSPTTYNNVTLFFSDLVGYTVISEKLKPMELIGELNDIFTEFDNIMLKYGCERMETIGDAYIGACGIPKPNPDHAKNIILAAKEILHYIKKRQNRSNDENTIPWSIRIGIHSGEVAEGLVGTYRYAYNIFGDTVNTASRMETNADPMTINVSEATYNLVSHRFDFIKRNPIEVKGKGVMNMYFLTTD